MEGSAAYFQDDMTFKIFVDGVVNDQKFTVIGEGSSKFPHGDFNIHAVCETGKLPMSWKPLNHILQYGMPVFVDYPNGLTNFPQDCFPEGFTIDRTVRFESDGTMTSHHTYELDGSCVIARVKLQCDGFNPEGAIMRDELVDILPVESHVYPWGDNTVRQICNIAFQKADGGIMMSHYDSTMKGCGSRKMRLPNPHFVAITNVQMKDDSEKRDHIVQREVAVAHAAKPVKSAI